MICRPHIWLFTLRVAIEIIHTNSSSLITLDLSTFLSITPSNKPGPDRHTPMLTLTTINLENNKCISYIVKNKEKHL